MEHVFEKFSEEYTKHKNYNNKLKSYKKLNLFFGLSENKKLTEDAFFIFEKKIYDLFYKPNIFLI